MIPWKRCALLGLLLAGSVSADGQVPLSASGTQASVPFCNQRRSGYTPQELKPPYRVVWVHAARHRPRPAWQEPVWEPQRIDFDYAYAVSAQGDTVYYASSVDHALHALDLASGREKWVYFTDAPVRLAPEFHAGHVLFTSDDGFLYCLKQADGSLVWKFRPEGIPDERLIGNEQMISRWAARSGVLIEGDRAYTTFGMLASEGVAVCCLDAASGRPRWINDTCGYHFMARPHSLAMGGVSPQGYLAVTDRLLVVTCGRSTPALFDKRTGRLVYHEADGDFTGGGLVMTADSGTELVFTQADTLKKEYGAELRRADESPESEIFDLATLVALDGATGREVFSLRGGSRGTLSDEGLITLIGRQQLIAVDLDDVRRATPAQATVIQHTLGHFVDNEKIRRWSAPVERVYSLLQAGQTLIAGGRGTVECFAASNGSSLWRGEVVGQARGLCVASDRLIVSTSEGQITCFAPAASAPSVTQTRAPERPAEPLPPPSPGGYCLVAGDCELQGLIDLARSFDLVIYAMTGGDPAPLRRRLDQADLYGTRVVVQRIDGPTLPYTDYFANEVRCAAGAGDPVGELAPGELYRVLRPCGGILTVMCPQVSAGEVRAALITAGVPEEEIHAAAEGLRVIRGTLAGAGQWTHQYGAPGKRAASDERGVRLPLKAAWFGGLGPATIVSRHFRTPAPLVVNGRCFVPGLDHLTAIDIYNGRTLWQRSLPDLAHWPAAYRGAGLAADDAAVYALQGWNCLVLDPATGETRATFPAPRETPDSDAPDPIWEYLAVTEDLLVGTLGQANIQRSWWSRAYPVSQVVFALEKRTGQLRWVHRAEEEIDSNAIAIDDGCVCLIDGRPRYGFLARRGEPPTGRGKPPRKLVALDLASGRCLWQQEHLAPAQNSLWMDDGVVVATPNPIGKDMTDPGVIKAGGGISAFATKDGTLLWHADQDGAVQPMIIDGIFYSPDAYDLHTGRELTHPENNQRVSLRAGTGCSTYSGCPTLAMSRFSSLGFKDLDGPGGSFTYPIVRSSCWINMIPAGGLVVVPEGSSSCQCAYNYKTSLGLISDDRQFHYGLGGTDRPGHPGLRVNFGAPGDRADRDGQIWYAYPRPVAYGRCLGDQPYGPKVAGPKLPIEEHPGESSAQTWGRNPDWIEIAGTEMPWLVACGLEGQLNLTIRPPQELQDQDVARWRVTLFFCELDAPSSPRVFDVQLQGETVLRGLHVAEAAGGIRKAIARSFTVEKATTVSLELVSSVSDGPPPSICGLEITADQNPSGS